MNLKRRIEPHVRPHLPSWAMQIYRNVRSLSRYLLRPIHDQISAYKYMGFINDQLTFKKYKGNQGLVLDLGANVGNFSHAARKMGFGVVAVEPHPEALKRLEKRFASDKKVVIISKAVGNVSGNAVLNFHPDHRKDKIHTSITASLISDKFVGEHEKTTVEQVSLDEIFEKFGAFEIVKIDIEGAELFLIDSLINNSDKISYLLLETHKRFMNLSKHADEYSQQMMKLENFIDASDRKEKWSTRWV